MSMLAEPKRKQKWSVDPRNSAWSKDENKFGQKMLERMGWSQGKGLGRSEQGSTEHIKVKLKNNNHGLGANASHEDNWIAHQDDFNDLLAELNKNHGQSNTNIESPADEQKSFSLEEKSKTSRKRVHYMKFTKGKDLSSRSETDLNCIFGKRGRSTKEQDQGGNSSDSQGDTGGTCTPVPSEPDTEAIANTVTSSMSIQEYFARRMAQLKKARGQAPSAEAETEAPSEEPDETPVPSEEASPILISDGEESEEPKKKKKKKKRSKEVEAPEESNDVVVIDLDADEQEQPKKKRKKSKTVEIEEVASENSSVSSGVEQDCEEQLPSKKKKKKKKNKLEKESEEAELPNGHTPTEEQTEESEVVPKKKKKHRQDEVDTIALDEEEEEVVVVVNKSKKDKKKKKKHQE